MSINPSSMSLLNQNSAWYKPSEELKQFYKEVEESKGDTEQRDTALDHIRSMFDASKYDETYITEDINSRKAQEQFLNETDGKELDLKILGYPCSSRCLPLQVQYYQTLQAIQAMFRLGVENGVIKEGQPQNGGIALSEINSNLPANLKMGWLLSQKELENSYIGIKDEITGESVSVTLRDTRSSNLHGKEMLSALTDPNKSNFLVRLATKKNINDPSQNTLNLLPNSTIQRNGVYLIRGINVTVEHHNQFTDDQDFLPPREGFDF